jgi:hypothetical protein
MNENNEMAKEQLYHYGLLFGCPMNEELEACAYKEIRQLSLSERIQYIQSISNFDRMALILKHKSCISQREDKVPFSRIAIL